MTPVLRPAWIDTSEYPFDAHTWPTGDGRMHYVDEGSGSPVVLLHGNPTWSFLYRHLICALRTDYRCLAPDYLGFGLSDKPADFSYAPPAHAAHVEALLTHLDLDGVTLVMHDWGGPIGLSYALRHPERVRRLVIFNTWMWPRTDDWPFYLFSKLMGGPLGRLLVRRGNAFARYVMPYAFGDRRRLTPAAHRHYLAPSARPRDRTGHHVFPRALMGEAPWLASLWAQRGRLAGLPALLIWGGRDPAFPAAQLRRWKAVLPSAEVAYQPTAGHYVPEELGAAAVPMVRRFLRTSS